jgi:quinol monooxygenase YgiN
MELTESTEVVTCLIEMRFAAEEADEAVQLLLAVVERIRAKAGCQVCWLSRDAADPRQIRFSEVWTTEAGFRAHLRSGEFRHVLMALDMCCEEPSVTIGEMSGRTGIEHLQKYCSGPAPDLDH